MIFKGFQTKTKKNKGSNLRNIRQNAVLSHIPFLFFIFLDWNLAQK